MLKVAKCPICGKDPQIMVFGAGWATDGIKCCGYTADTVKLWNIYAAAMEFAFRYAESIGPHAEEMQAHIAMKNHPDYLKMAQDRVLEVLECM